MVIITVDEDLCEEWEKLCPKQVMQAKAFVLAGKIPNSNSRWSTLTRLGAAVLRSIQQGSLRLILMSIHASRFQTLRISLYDTLIIKSRCVVSLLSIS